MRLVCSCIHQNRLTNQYGFQAEKTMIVVKKARLQSWRVGNLLALYVNVCQIGLIDYIQCIMRFAFSYQ